MDLINGLVAFLPYLGYLLLAIMILVFVHEMGHFLFAKLFGMRVERFSVGFPPKIIGKQIGETEYVIGATPLGGYVKIVGMVDESMDTEGLQSEPQPWEFRAKPVWQRIVVITAGVIFNMILAWIIFSAIKGTYGESFIPAQNVAAVYVPEGTLAHDIGLRTGDRIVRVGDQTPLRFTDIQEEILLTEDLTMTVERGGQEQTLPIPPDMITRLNRAEGDFGLYVDPALVGAVVPDSPAEQVGLQAGDLIVGVNGAPVRFFPEFQQAVAASQGAPVTLRIQRADSLATGAPADTLREVGREPLSRIYETTIAARAVSDTLYQIGVNSPSPLVVLEHYGAQRERFGFGQAMVAGAEQTWSTTGAILTSLKRVFSGRDNLRENLGGPVMVGKIVGEAGKLGWGAFWNIVAMLSITLAIMNILPIPALDGGHLVFLIYEGIFRREPSLKFRMVTQQIGMAVLLLFMVFLIFNDTLRLFTS